MQQRVPIPAPVLSDSPPRARHGAAQMEEGLENLPRRAQTARTPDVRAPFPNPLRDRAQAALHRARTDGRPFSVVAVRQERPDRWGAVRPAVARGLADLSGAEPIQLADAPVLVAFVPGRAVVEASHVAELLIERVRLDPDPARPAIGVGLSCDLCLDGNEPLLETLIEVALEGARVALLSGGDRWVHSELYDLLGGQVLRRGAVAALRPVPEPRTPVRVEPEPPEVPDPSAGDARRIDLLERRVAKLIAQLEHAERRPTTGAETGIASIYRDVQGLDPGARDPGLKLALMDRIFEANLELQKRRLA